MSNTDSSKGKYVCVALLGAAVGGAIVALSAGAVPKMMSGMMAKCKRMMPEMTHGDYTTADMCQRMAAGMGRAPQHATCESEGGTTNGID